MFEIIRVEGSSMAPVFRDGDYVLVGKGFIFTSKLKKGDVIAFNQIAYGVMIKKVDRLESESGLIHVIGENIEHSIDSRQFGPVHRHDLIGKVIFHIPKSD